MPVSCFNDSRMVGANRYANSKAVGMSFLERIWQKKFSKSSLKVATSLRKLLNPGLTSFRKSLNEHNRFLAFSFPVCVFCVFPCRWCRQRHSDDSLMTLIVMYFNNSLTIWDTEMNAIDKEKKISLTGWWSAHVGHAGGGEHDTQSGKVFKGIDALNTSIKWNEQSKQQ